MDIFRNENSFLKKTEKKMDFPCVSWCTMQVGGAQCSPELLRWCTTKILQTLEDEV